MPLYEYKCSKCEKTFEKRQKFADAPLTVCECGDGGPVQRALSTPAFHLKGGGWYKDGYGSGKSGSDKSGGSNGSSEKKSSTESKPAESKPAESKPASTASTDSK